MQRRVMAALRVPTCYFTRSEGAVQVFNGPDLFVVPFVPLEAVAFKQ